MGTAIGVQREEVPRAASHLLPVACVTPRASSDPVPSGPVGMDRHRTLPYIRWKVPVNDTRFESRIAKFRAIGRNWEYFLDCSFLFRKLSKPGRPEPPWTLEQEAPTPVKLRYPEGILLINKKFSSFLRHLEKGE